jgi:hypothetical protein
MPLAYFFYIKYDAYWLVGSPVKRFIMFGVMLAVAAGCATSKTPTSKEPVSVITPPPSASPRTILTEEEVLRIGKQFAEEKRWEIVRGPSRSMFVEWMGAWQMLFKVKGHGGPFIVYVNDVTGLPHFVKGE